MSIREEGNIGKYTGGGIAWRWCRDGINMKTFH